jgi:hypothetical protein
MSFFKLAHKDMQNCDLEDLVALNLQFTTNVYQKQNVTITTKTAISAKCAVMVWF